MNNRVECYVNWYRWLIGVSIGTYYGAAYLGPVSIHWCTKRLKELS